MLQLPLTIGRNHPPRRVLCLGAHADDIEIGCGGTLLKLLQHQPNTEIFWVVFSATGERRREALASARVFLAAARRSRVVVKSFKESFFPYVADRIKEFFETFRNRFEPDLIFTHYGKDLHQDHRVLSELTWNTFRNHWILEFEIPKYDGGIGSPNCFVPLGEETCRRKIACLLRAFRSQRRKHWFTEDTFRAILRLRGIECSAPERFAEAFYCRKLVLG